MKTNENDNTRWGNTLMERKTHVRRDESTLHGVSENILL